MSDSIEALRAAISGGKALLVCGAGVSSAVTNGAAPGWKGLIESAIDSAPKEPGEDWSEHFRQGLKRNDPDAWLSSADMAQRKLGGFSNNSYRAWLMKNVGELQASEPALLDAIIALNCRLATTNYDGLLCTKKGVQPKTWRNPDSVAEILTGKSQNVWHIHGYWDDPESVIFSTADYDRVGRSDRAQFLQQQAAFADTLIFIGCSASGLADQNVGRLLNWFGSSWGGLGKKHFALVTDDEVETPGWPGNVTLVPYGPKHEKLLEFLRSLDPQSSPPQASASKVNRIDLAIANPHPVGRLGEINEVITAALDGRPCLITGGPGMGKTTLAVAASYDGNLIERFGERRVFVNLENRADPLDALILLAAELGLSPEPKQSATLAAIRYSCEKESTFAILDNVEGLIEADEPETSRILSLLRDTAGLSFVVTSRESLPFLSGWTKIDDLSPLSLKESRDLFCKIATSVGKDDPDLEPLLIALDGHALSLTIIASRVDSDLTLGPMLRRWENEKALLLRRPGLQEARSNSVIASLRVSLTSRHMTPVAKRLLAILGFLPDGLPAGGLKAFLGQEDRRINAIDSDTASEALRRLRLVGPRLDGAIRLLNPIREAVRLELPIMDGDLQRVIQVELKLLEKGKYFGTELWPEAKRVLEPHLTNITTVLVECGRNQSIASINRAIEFARRLASGEKRFDFHAFVKLASVLTHRNGANVADVRTLALLAAADFALNRHELQLVDDYLTQASIVCDNQDVFDSTKARLFYYIGVKCGLQSNFELAIEYFQKALKLFSGDRDLMSRANSYEALANVYAQKNEPALAKMYSKNAMEICLKKGYLNGAANAECILGIISRRERDFDESARHTLLAKNIYEKVDNISGIATTLSDYALIESNKNINNAEKLFDTALKQFRTIGAEGGIAQTEFRIAQLAFFIRGDTSSMPSVVQKILALETSHRDQLSAPGWRAFCLSLIEQDQQRQASLREEARNEWTRIGAMGLVSDYLDFEFSNAAAEQL
ncbi:MAG TPA: SIR2 family protein [Methylocystis sp.]|jgi:tetratricopeptide (TPR) repeat protein